MFQHATESFLTFDVAGGGTDILSRVRQLIAEFSLN